MKEPNICINITIFVKETLSIIKTQTGTGQKTEDLKRLVTATSSMAETDIC
jgi:hypothetical protein